jgi:prepilin signal peptidase PulO-like enzyme (type II secretory pathway)
MTLILFIFLFIAGATMASFFNLMVADYRLILKKRSTCNRCKRVLTVGELIPVVSYVRLDGKCVKCKQKIGVHHLYGEIMGGVSFVLFGFYAFGAGLLDNVYFAVFFLLFLFLALYDLKYKEIPLSVLVLMSGIGYSAVFLPQNHVLDFESRIIGAAVGALLIWTPYFLTKKRGFGEGDIVICLIIGYLFGWPGVILTVVFASLLASVLTLPLLVTGKLARKSQIPFVPFLFLGALMYLTWGVKVIKWYLDLIFL